MAAYTEAERSTTYTHIPRNVPEQGCRLQGAIVPYLFTIAHLCVVRIEHSRTCVGLGEGVSVWFPEEGARDMREREMEQGLALSRSDSITLPEPRGHFIQECLECWVCTEGSLHKGQLSWPQWEELLETEQPGQGVEPPPEPTQLFKPHLQAHIHMNISSSPG